MEGWIRLHRQLKEHWIWKSNNRLKWWIDILLTVNHTDNKILIKGNLIECKRGQSIRSLENWAKEWNVTKGAVRDFFKLLEKDQMLHTESLQFTTRITVNNYDNYQNELHTKKTLRKRSGNDEGTQTIMNNNVNNEKKYIREISLEEISDPYLKITFHFWKLFKDNTETEGIKPTTLLKAKIQTWVDSVRLMVENKECTMEQLRELYTWLKKKEGKQAQFWAVNIRSTSKLREQLEKLLLNMKQESDNWIDRVKNY